MPVGAHSARYKHRVVSAIKVAWLKNPDKPRKAVTAIYEEYMLDIAVPDSMKDRLDKDISDYMVRYLTDRYESWIVHGLITIPQVEQYINYQPLDIVYRRMISMIDLWTLTYNGPVPKLKDINNSQSVHEKIVVNTTNKGIDVLLQTSVPSGQKTLAEIERAWAGRPGLFTVMQDMREWGNKEKVMSDVDNTFRKALRGLWATLGRVSDPDMKNELINRLWEESKEAVGMCADGHVARLVNVLVGFDDRFTTNLSPKEYFQNNIALIAGSSAPIKFKIDQATRLMDDINMPIEDRESWLESLAG